MSAISALFRDKSVNEVRELKQWSLKSGGYLFAFGVIAALGTFLFLYVAGGPEFFSLSAGYAALGIGLVTGGFGLPILLHAALAAIREKQLQRT